jgi:SAM-dependent methyltransferase
LEIDNININTFNQWAIKGKDKGMEVGHAPAVDRMFKIILSQKSIVENPFNFLDLGCGNGWVIRKILKNKNCIYALGIDGAPEMIKKAKHSDNIGNYIATNIEHEDFTKSFDIIFSMETFYYFKDLDSVLNKVYNNLNKNGLFIIGIDHYLENKPSLTWDKEFNLSLNTLSIKDWISKFKTSGFKNIQSTIYGAKENWNGTLILFANK